MCLDHLVTSTLFDPKPLSLCRLIGDVLLCTGFLSYLGPFNQDFRILLNNRWSKELRDRRIPFTQSLNIVDMLVEPTTVSIVSDGTVLLLFGFFLDFQTIFWVQPFVDAAQ